MNKQEFLAELRSALSGLPQDDIEERAAFYSEMIDDRMEEGLTEAEAVAGVGPIDGIVEQTVSEVPLTKLVKEQMKAKRSLRGWEIFLIALGSPVWFPLLIAFGAVVLSLYVVLWALIISLWAIDISLWACVLGGIAAAVIALVRGKTLSALALFGAALFCVGLSILMFGVCTAATKGLLRLTKRAALRVKSRFVRKGSKK